MKSDTTKLKDILAAWKQWSRTANQSEDGWQVGFPEWTLMMTTSAKLMTRSELTDEEIKMVESCWQMSEEGEDLADYTRSNLRSCWPTLLRLIGSRFPEVRWQIYDVLGEGGHEVVGW